MKEMSKEEQQQFLKKKRNGLDVYVNIIRFLMFMLAISILALLISCLIWLTKYIWGFIV